MTDEEMTMTYGNKKDREPIHQLARGGTAEIQNQGQPDQSLHALNHCALWYGGQRSSKQGKVTYLYMMFVTICLY